MHTTASSGPAVPAVSAAHGAQPCKQFEPPRMRTRYRQNLRQLAGLMHSTCVLDCDALTAATDALVTADPEQSQAAIVLGSEAEAMAHRAEHEATRLLALQAPVAGELRQVVTAIQLSANLRRMAVLASTIATAAHSHSQLTLPEPIRPLISQMGEAAIAIATSAAAALDATEPYAATTLNAQDGVMNRLYDELLSTVRDPAWDHGNTTTVDLILVGQYYKRFADDAVEVARRTVLSATGGPNPALRSPDSRPA